MRKSRRFRTFILLAVLCLAVACVVSLLENKHSAFSDPLEQSAFGQEDSLLEVYFFDVDQADSALFRAPDGQTMLIDAGDVATKYELQKKLEALQVERIDILIGTHPHSDHIGGMQQIVENFDIGCIYLPDYSHTSKTYLNLLDSILAKNIPVYEAKAGVSFSLGEQVQCNMLAPCKSYDDANNASAVVHITYGDISFLMTGDAEAPAEKDILAQTARSSLRSTVLKMGHHGSDTSSSEAFLDAVSPKYAIISCGIGNSYGHPHTETLQHLAERKILTFRTDELGDILVLTNGKTLTFSKEGIIPTVEADQLQYVYVTDSGKTYHKEDCSSLSRSKNRITLQEAKERGFSACKRCFDN